MPLLAKKLNAKIDVVWKLLLNKLQGYEMNAFMHIKLQNLHALAFNMLR